MDREDIIDIGFTAAIVLTIDGALGFGIYKLLERAERAKMEPPVSTGYIHKYDLPSSYVYEFALNDGTRCLLDSRGGLTCDWKGAAK